MVIYVLNFLLCIIFNNLLNGMDSPEEIPEPTSIYKFESEVISAENEAKKIKEEFKKSAKGLILPVPPKFVKNEQYQIELQERQRSIEQLLSTTVIGQRSRIMCLRWRLWKKAEALKEIEKRLKRSDEEVEYYIKRKRMACALNGVTTTADFSPLDDGMVEVKEDKKSACASHSYQIGEEEIEYDLEHILVAEASQEREKEKLESVSFLSTYPDCSVPLGIFKKDVEAILAGSVYSVAQAMTEHFDTSAEVKIYQRRLEKTQSFLELLQALPVEEDARKARELKDQLSVHAADINELKSTLKLIAEDLHLKEAWGKTNQRKREVRFILNEATTVPVGQERSAKRRRKNRNDTVPVVVLDYEMVVQEVQQILDADINALIKAKAETTLYPHEFSDFIKQVKKQNGRIKRLIRKVLKETQPRERVQHFIPILKERMEQNKRLLNKESIILECLKDGKNRSTDKKSTSAFSYMPRWENSSQPHVRNEHSPFLPTSIFDTVSAELKESVEHILDIDLPSLFMLNPVDSLSIDELLSWQSQLNVQNVRLNVLLQDFPQIEEGPGHMLRLRCMARWINNRHIEDAIDTYIATKSEVNDEREFALSAIDWHLPVKENSWDAGQAWGVEAKFISYQQHKDPLPKLHPPSNLTQRKEKYFSSSASKHDPTILVCLLGKADRSITLDMIVQLCNQRIEKKFFDGDPYSYTADQLKEFKRELGTQKKLFREVLMHHAHTLNEAELEKVKGIVAKRFTFNKAVKAFIKQRLIQISLKNPTHVPFIKTSDLKAVGNNLNLL